MGWRFLLLSGAGLLVAGCTTVVPAVPASDWTSDESFHGDPCINRDLGVSFKPGAAYPDTGFLGPLHWAIRAKAECRGFRLTVRGLPAPSERSLQGQRAAALQSLLDTFELRPSRFVVGSTIEQDSPRIEVRVRP